MSDTSTTIGIAIGEPARSSERVQKERRHQRRFLGRLTLVLADVIVVQVAIVLAALELRVFQGDPEQPLWTAALGVACSVAVLIPSILFGLYSGAGLGSLDRFRLRITAGIMLPWLGLAPLAVVQPVTMDAIVRLCATAVFFVPLGLLVETLVSRILIACSAWGSDAVVIGSGESANRVAEALLAQPEVGLRPIGYCGDPGSCHPSRLARLGPLADIGKLADVADVAVVVTSASTPALDMGELPFRRIVVVPDANDIPAVHLRGCTLGGIAGLQFVNPARVRSHHLAKRLLDLLLALPLFVLVLPVILCTALGIRIVSRGPAFFVQRRVGWNGQPVAIYKLRSMYVDADRRLEELLRDDPAARLEWQTYVKLSRDPRILPLIGNFIRRTSIDELPQLWNVVRGDISLVGPRPFPTYHVEKFSAEFQKLRCSVRPGLTGLWQVSGRSSADLRQQEAIDTFYIRNWSLWLDLHILFRTLPAVLSARGSK